MRCLVSVCQICGVSWPIYYEECVMPEKRGRLFEHKRSTKTKRVRDGVDCEGSLAIPINDIIDVGT